MAFGESARILFPGLACISSVLAATMSTTNSLHVGAVMTRTVLGIASFTLLALWATSLNFSKSGDPKQPSDLAAVTAVSKTIIDAGEVPEDAAGRHRVWAEQTHGIVQRRPGLD